MSSIIRAQDAEFVVELLPARETLCSISIGSPTIIVGLNFAIAVNAASLQADATALANQYISAALG